MKEKMFDLKSSNLCDLAGKVAIVTGANTGIGKATAMGLARRNCHVILACRNMEKGENAKEEIVKESKNFKIDVMELDMSSFNSVLDFVDKFRNRNLPLHILVNNAAIMSPPNKTSEDGLEIHFQVNFASHFLLTNKLLDILELSAPSRVVNVSSSVHKTVSAKSDWCFVTSQSSPKAYALSKLFNIMYTRKLANLVKGKKIYVNCNDTGLTSTRILKNITETYGKTLGFIGESGLKIIGSSPEEGALTSLFLAASPMVEEKELNGVYLLPNGHTSMAGKFAQDDLLCNKLFDETESILVRKLSTDYTPLEQN